MSLPPRRQSDSPGHKAALIFRTNALLIDKKVAALGLCAGQVPYVVALSRHAGWTQDELAEHLRVHRTATARTLKTMEAAGLVRRTVNPANKRQKFVYPTPKAEALVPPLLDILARHHADMLTGFSAEEQRQLLALMDRIVDNIETMLHNGENTDEETR